MGKAIVHLTLNDVQLLTLFNATVYVVQALQAENEQTTLVQISQAFLGQVAKAKDWKKDQFSKLPGFGAAKGKYNRSEIERILYHMVLRQYLREMVCALLDTRPYRCICHTNDSTSLCVSG
jgi:hypothetical protein